MEEKNTHPYIHYKNLILNSNYWNDIIWLDWIQAKIY